MFKVKCGLSGNGHTLNRHLKKINIVVCLTNDTRHVYISVHYTESYWPITLEFLPFIKSNVYNPGKVKINK